MKLAIIGATGFIGGAIFKEALSRGHEVVAISRRNSVEQAQGVTIFQQTIFDKDDFKKAIRDVDVIISAYNPGYYHVNQHQRFLDAYALLKEVSMELDKKIIMVLGMSSLYVDDELKVTDSVAFPKALIQSLTGPLAVYETYVDDDSFKWTMVSPSAEVIDTEKTQNYVIDFDKLIVNEADVSRVSVQDLADAIVNEAEKNQYTHKRFTVGYRK